MKCYAHLSSLAVAPPPPVSVSSWASKENRHARKEEHLFFSPHSIHRACENSPLLGPPDRAPRLLSAIVTWTIPVENEKPLHFFLAVTQLDSAMTP